MVRTFLAIDLPLSVREGLLQEQRGLQRQLPVVSWIRLQALHITMKFLGDLPEDQIDAIRDAMTRSLQNTVSFVIALQGLGVFPNSQAPRILWVGIGSGNEQLRSLANNIDVALGPIGFPAERKPFHPHVTLARVKKDHRRFGQTLSQNCLLTHSLDLNPLLVDRLTLFKSELRPTGSVYTRLWEVPFQRA